MKEISFPNFGFPFLAAISYLHGGKISVHAQHSGSGSTNMFNMKDDVSFFFTSISDSLNEMK